MKRTLSIKNFKCFAELAVPLAQMTVFCGPNSGGKSTIIQALLLHAYASSHRDIPLNGPYGMQLGESENLVSRNASDDANDGFTVAMSPGYSVSFSAGQSPRYIIADLSEGTATASDVLYLSAERVGPRLVQESYSDIDPSSTNVGHSGQYSAEVLLGREREQVRKELRPGDAKEKILLRSVVEHYMGELFGPIEVQARPNGNAPPSIYFKRPGVEEDWVIASHTGFGITYALPVILGGLLAAPGSTLIVDSPEAHLHPFAQTAIARFLSKIASSGVNVILETHSDYIVDGLRISITSSEDNTLAGEECVLVSVGSGVGGSKDVRQITIRSDGKPSEWPPGFFDQHVHNMQAILSNTSQGV